jgi:hypothetical protein
MDHVRQREEGGRGGVQAHAGALNRGAQREQTEKAADRPPSLFYLNFSFWEPSPDYALATIAIISVIPVIITLFFENVPVQSIQVTFYIVPFPLTNTAI